MEVVQSMDGTMAALTEQVAQLHVDVADLQERLAEQGTAVEALSGTFLTFSSEMTGQVEATTAQLRRKAASWKHCYLWWRPPSVGGGLAQQVESSRS